MNILFSVTNLSIGGAQMFVLNLAREFSKDKKYKVFIYDHQPEYSNPELYKYAGKNIVIGNYGGRTKRFFIQKLNGITKRFFNNGKIRDSYNKKSFERFLQDNQIDIVNSQMSYSDFICSNSVKYPTKLVLTLHGEFELMKSLYVKDINLKIDSILSKKPTIIYTADKNRLAISDLLEKYRLKTHKIYIGIQPKNFKNPNNITKNFLGISRDDFVLGMISRGIPEKGWDFLITVFQKLKNESKSKKVKLLLIGDGDYIINLVKNTNDPDIIITKPQKNYQDYFFYYPLFDLFVFPTFFPGESVPAVIAESLFWETPVIANEIGEIPAMINSTEKKRAGYTISISDKEQMIKNYIQVISDLIKNESKLSELKSNCKNAFLKFDISEIKNQYEKVFHEY